MSFRLAVRGTQNPAVSLPNLAAAQQIVGRERRERVSQLAYCCERCFDSRRRVNSIVRLYPSNQEKFREYTIMAHDVFISYSTTDKTIADAVCATLEAKGIRCWIAPRDVQPGTPYGEALINALNESRIMVLVFSSDSNNSLHVMREVERAVNKGLPIIPFRIEDVPLSKNMEYFISVPHWLDALTPPLEKHLQQLAETIETLAKKQIHYAEIEGKVPDTSKRGPLENLNFRIDAALLKKHRKAFLRPAFGTPCIWELFLDELIGAIDDTQAAINTGNLYSRARNLLSNFPDRGEYKTPEFRDAFREISKLLTEVKREAINFKDFFLSIYPEYDFRYECYGMIIDFYNQRPDLRHHIPQMFKHFDKIDALRNMILQILNTLLRRCDEEPFELIELSSDEVRNKEIGNAEYLYRYLYSTLPLVEDQDRHLLGFNAYEKKIAKDIRERMETDPELRKLMGKRKVAEDKE